MKNRFRVAVGDSGTGERGMGDGHRSCLSVTDQLPYWASTREQQ